LTGIVAPSGASVTISRFLKFACPDPHFILGGMYVPLPAKLPFTIDDGWNRLLDSDSDSISPWTRLYVEYMLACSTQRYF
jgi:hypothetical protein